MDRQWDSPNSDHELVYGSTLQWNSIRAEDAEYLVHFNDQLVDPTWITAYEAIDGHRKYPFYACNVSKGYEQMIDAFSVAQGMLIPIDPPALGGAPMLTFTKFVRDIEQRFGLPVFDVDNTVPNETPYPLKYLLTTERLLFMNCIFGLPLSEATIAIVSLDILDDLPDDLNEFPFGAPLNKLPGSQESYSMLNSECANSNGVIQKAYGEMIAQKHSEPIYVAGVPVLPKNDETHCF
jgi:hypothetical protein